MSVSRKTIQTLAGHLLVFAQSIILTPIIIKVSGTEVYGAYVLLLSYLGIVFGVSSLGVGISAKRWLPSTTSAIERAERFYPQFWFQLISCAILAILTVIFAYRYVDTTAGLLRGLNIWLILSYLFSYAIYSQISDYFRYTHRIGVFNLATVAQPYLYIFIAISIYKVSNVLSPRTLVISMVASSVVVGVLLFVKSSREIGIIFQLPNLSELKREIKLGFPLVLSYLVDVILSSGDRYVIAFLLSVRDVGMYSPAYALGSLAMVLPKVFGVVLPPLIAQRIDSADEQGARRLLNSAAKTFLIVSVPYIIGAAILGKAILQIYANAEIADVAWPVISIVAVASVFYGLILIKANILFVRLDTGYLFRINLLSSVLNILLNIVLIKLFGNVIVSAVATLVTYLISYILLSRRLEEDSVSFSIEVNWLLRIVACALGMGLSLVLISEFMPTHSLMYIVIAMILGLVVYLLLTLSQVSIRSELFAITKSLIKR